MKSETRRKLTALATFGGVVLAAVTLVVLLIPASQDNSTLQIVQATTSAAAVVLFVGGLVLMVYHLPEDIDAKIDAHREDVLAEHLRKVVPAPEALLRAVRQDGDLVEAVAGRVIHDFLDGDVARYVKELEDYQADGNPINFRHSSSVYGVLDSLLESIPDNSCWLGISHIGTLDGWENEDFNDFKSFQAHSRARTRNNKITMLRVYVTTREYVHALEPFMTREREANIVVRYLIVPDESQRKEWEDTSLVWLPPSGRARKDLPRLDFDDGRQPDTTLQEAAYSPLCFLRFKSHDMSLLSEVELSSAKRPHDRTFRELVERFGEAWSSADAV